MYLVKNTPQPTAVELLQLGTSAESGLITAEGWQPFSILASKLVTQDKAEHLWLLWKQLPAGEQMRCHIPPLGMRFIKDGSILLECSLCWQCNNIFIVSDGSFTDYEFDASSDISLKLKSIMQAYLIAEE